ncbi:MAG: flavin reductase [Rhodobacteraceae bacterium]|nr:flavin reductase [Paracoccaceae bacterium]
MLDAIASDPRALRNAFGRFATGVTISSFSSLSLDPPLCLFSLGKSQVSCRWIEAGDAFNVNILAHDQQAAAWQFAKPLEDKFDGVKWYAGRNGLPVIHGNLCHFECAKWDIHDGGDHIIVVGRIEHFAEGAGDPLLFYRGAMTTLAE